LNLTHLDLLDDLREPFALLKARLELFSSPFVVVDVFGVHLEEGRLLAHGVADAVRLVPLARPFQQLREQVVVVEAVETVRIGEEAGDAFLLQEARLLVLLLHTLAECLQSAECIYCIE
jgi:hypothetical protein